MILPIVKFCYKRNSLHLFTRIHYHKNDTIFTLQETTGKINNYIYMGNGKYSNDVFSIFIRHSINPSCKIIGKDIIASHNILPGTEITYDQIKHEKKLKENEMKELKQKNIKIKKFLHDLSLI